jgi:hypothetical protein
MKLAPKLIGILAAVATFLFLLLSKQVFEQVDAGEYVVIQYPNGSLNVVTTPGYAAQWFGTVEHFKRSAQYSFTPDKQDAGDIVKTRFNDGAHGYISGSIRYDLPSDPPHLIDLYRTYRNQNAIDRQLVGQNITKAIYMAGPLMSSKESYSDRRNELISIIDDQATNGIYQTVPKDVEMEDPITQSKKWVRVVDIRRDKTGMALRQESSPITRFGITLYNLTINDVKYDDVVEKQIAAQQQAIMMVQTAIAQSKEAEQKVLTVTKQGEANAASAKWEQEIVKAREVTKAEQNKAVAETNAQRDKDVAELAAQRDKNVAELQKQAAEFTKQQQISLGQGESERKRLVMAANGALEQKLDTYLRAQQVWAQALGAYRGNIVPSVVTGAAAGSGNAVQSFFDLINAKTAKDLSLDMTMIGPRVGQANPTP